MVDRSFADVLQDIVLDIQAIIRSEVKLAKTELRENFRTARSGALLLGIGGLSGVFAICFLLVAVLYALSTAMPNWAAALILASALALGAAIAIGLGIKRTKSMSVGSKAVESVKENIEWTKQQLR